MTGNRGAAHAHRVVEAVWRIESARLIAGLARMTHDVGLAEELAQDALVAALEQWPAEGVPDNPGAWLMSVAKRRAIDQFRRSDRYADKLAAIGRDLDDHQDSFEPEVVEALDDTIGDDMLRLVFTACHPVLSAEARVALTLRCLGGLTTDEIARAYFVPGSTIAQRIVRAKKTLTEKKIAFELPQREELGDRLSSVLEVIYLIFNEGYSATAGQSWTRPALCEEALRLGRVVAELMPGEAEVLGLVALMEIQASRLRARVGPSGEPVTLTNQNRALWDRLLIQRGLAALRRAEATAAPFGPYRLQAEIAACHARALTVEATEWGRIAALYGLLSQVAPSPVIELNRAVAVSMADGPQPALDMVDALVTSGSLDGYHLLPAVRADLLTRLGRHSEARDELIRAAELTRNESERALLRARAARPTPRAAALSTDRTAKITRNSGKET